MSRIGESIEVDSRFVVTRGQEEIAVVLEISSPVLFKVRWHLEGPKGFSNSWKG